MRRVSCPSRSLSLVCKIPVLLLGLSETNTIGYYRQALALTEALGMRPLQAHCHQGLGTLYAATGQREQARTALATAMAMYRAMEMTF